MRARILFLRTEADVVASIRKGGREGLLRLFDESRRQVVSLVTRNGGSMDDADDVLQESVIIAWERIRSGNYEQTAALSTFVIGIARKLWLRRLGRRKREVPGLDAPETIASDEPDELDRLVSDEQKAAMARAFRLLDPLCRTLLLLFYWERASMDEIAGMVGLANAETAKARKYQCKQKLRKLAEGRFDAG